ncbi:unnamed protein product, partial [Iphiclides podalirius]
MPFEVTARPVTPAVHQSNVFSAARLSPQFTNSRFTLIPKDSDPEMFPESHPNASVRGPVDAWLAEFHLKTSGQFSADGARAKLTRPRGRTWIDREIAALLRA